MSWLIYALISAFFAALTAIFAKIGVKGINSSLATALRTIVVLLFVWAIVIFQGSVKEIGSLPKYSLFFLILSGIATGLSWLFYFKALQMGNVSLVSTIDKLSLVLTVVFASLILKEKLTPQIVFGSLLMTLGAIFIALSK